MTSQIYTGRNVSKYKKLEMSHLPWYTIEEETRTLREIRVLGLISLSDLLTHSDISRRPVFYD